ncbi:hypothetical protein PORY_002757 [Pneumocystis oryctolagi]|uniref:Uncharacterized protein n=1 Tax=Pneumocystis oryctolagi TaxID=42067 RepID=A0ACB7CA74_9ASCO|nr:hypothetical protein PORY_002757 [Pneumocystis oryctolagi]
MINNIISTFPPFKTISIALPDTSNVRDLENYLFRFLPSGNYFLSHLSGRLVYPEETLLSLSDRYQYSGDKNVCMFRCIPRVLGGKGGFGSQLRAAGGRMSSRKKRGQEENKLSCRDLNGRRIRAIKEAKMLEKYLETEAIQKREILAKRKQRLQAIIDAEPPSQRLKYDDNEYLEKNEMIIEDVKNTVKLVMEKSKHSPKTEVIKSFDSVNQLLGFNKEKNTNFMFSNTSNSTIHKTNKRSNKWDQEDFILSDDESLESK